MEKKTRDEWLVELVLMYYASGDFQDIYEYPDYKDFKETFKLKNDNEVAGFLARNEGNLQPDNLTFIGQLDISHEKTHH